MVNCDDMVILYFDKLVKGMADIADAGVHDVHIRVGNSHSFHIQFYRCICLMVLAVRVGVHLVAGSY